MGGELRFDGKVALITGAGRGLGAAYAQLLAGHGASVAVNDAGVDVGSIDERPHPALDVVGQITDAGGRAVADEHDVVTDGAAAVERALDAFGRLDIVICNAGFAGGGPFAEVDDDLFARVVDVHLAGTRSVLKAAWPHLVSSGRGRIVTTASDAIFGSPGLSPYSTGKSAVFGFTRVVAQEGAAVGVNANCVLPAAYTRLTALLTDERVVTMFADHFPPERIAPFVGWLVHESTDVTGEAFSVGGGRAARVFLAQAAGVQVAPDATMADWAARRDELLNTDEFEIPPTMTAALRHAVRRLGLTDGPFRLSRNPAPPDD